MKVISCASYYGTGSSAITDFFSEFDNIYSLTNYEFRFLQDPDGVSDLEYNLVENHNRHNSGHALKRFKKLTDFNAGTFFNKRYEPFFNNQYKKISYEYIEALTDFTFKGYWFYDFYDKGKIYYYLKLLPNKLKSILHSKNTETTYANVLPNEITYCSNPGEDNFLKYTREYTTKLMDAANRHHLPYIMVDQIVPPSNVNRFVRYFDDIKVVVVERDPRDLYILSKYIWKDNVIPAYSVDLFCKWYKYTRAHRKTEHYDSNTTLLVQFEDLVYKYEETASSLMQWVNIKPDHHTYPGKYFNPSVSRKNTRLWFGKSEFDEEIDYISKELTDYLYDYSGVL